MAARIKKTRLASLELVSHCRQTHSLGFDIEGIGPDEAGIIVWTSDFLASVFQIN